MPPTPTSPLGRAFFLSLGLLAALFASPALAQTRSASRKSSCETCRSRTTLNWRPASFLQDVPSGDNVVEEIPAPGPQMQGYPPGPEFDPEFGPGPDGPCGCDECQQSCCQQSCCQLPRADYCPDDCCGDWRWWENLELFAGVHGFKGPVDVGLNGNFGFHEGLNVGFPISRCLGLGGQLGVLVTQSNLSGSTPGVLTGMPDDSRDQVFLTAGLFHRTNCGLQWGAAWDSMHDEYYVEMDLNQLRAEVSYVCPNGREWGVMATITDETDTETFRLFNGVQLLTTWEAIDQYAIFYRRHFCNGSWGRIWGGTTGEGDGLLGGEAVLPFNPCLALSANAIYVIPEEGSADFAHPGHTEEFWALGIRLVWYTGRGSCCTKRSCDADCYRPLFRVADPSIFVVDRPQPPAMMMPPNGQEPPGTTVPEPQ